MADLSKLLKQLQQPEKVFTPLTTRVGKATSQWFLEKDVETHPIHDRNKLQFMIGAEGFAAIETDIRKATSTIDIICWGFDPAMELTREAGLDANGIEHAWPRGTPYGDLLAEKALSGVQVRLLLWGDNISPFVGNAPDKPLAWKPMPGFRQAYRQASRNNTAYDAADLRAAYASAWWKAALAGEIRNLEIRTRQRDAASTEQLLARYLPGAVTGPEKLALLKVATHHQKPILIDYHPGQGSHPNAIPNACGYVMGLNSTTDYWDTEHHLYNDPRREVQFGASLSWVKPWHRKPYRDYAMRVEGEALACLNRNFVNAWDRARPAGSQVPVGNPKAVLTSLRRQVIAQGRGGHRTQIIRTQPEENDASILKSYVLATSNALNYIYVENQYFQLAEWVNLIKDVRSNTVDMLVKAGGKFSALPPLHLMVVTPQAELDQMVPRTYDAMAEMGQGTSVQGYHKQVEDLQAGRAVKDNQGKSINIAQRDVLQDSAKINSADVKQELDDLNIRTLTAMLMTYDYGNEAATLRVKQRDNKAGDAEAARQRAVNPDHLAPDEDHGQYKGYQIIPPRYREVYIHSKLMLIDDCYVTLGSANLNVRSMVADSEINIASAEYEFAKSIRQRVWSNLAGADLDGGNGSRAVTEDTFKRWVKRMGDNAKEAKKGASGLPPENNSYLHTHYDPRDAPLFRLA